VSTAAAGTTVALAPGVWLARWRVLAAWVLGLAALAAVVVLLLVWPR